MIRSLQSVFLAVLLVSASVPVSVRAQDYTLDDQHTSIVFAVSHLGYSYCYGMFGRYTGEMTFDPANPAASKFRLVVDAASLDTKSEKRDEHLRGPDFFNVNQFPEITFVSEGVEASEKNLNVSGILTLHGVSKPVVLPLVHMGGGPGPDGKEHVGFTGQLVIKRSDFEMTTYLPNIGDEVTLILSFEGVK